MPPFRRVSDAAVGHDLATFARGICRRLRQAGEDRQGARHRQRRNRRATATIDDEGMFDFRALGPADEGEESQSLFQPWVDDVLRAGWRAGEARTSAQARWDALLAMARAGPPNRSPTPGGAAEATPAKRPAGLAHGRGSRVKVIVRVDLTGPWCVGGSPPASCATCPGSARSTSPRCATSSPTAPSCPRCSPQADQPAPHRALRRHGSPTSSPMWRNSVRVAPDHPLVPPAARGADPGMSADPTGHLHRLARFLAAFLDELGPNLQPIDELVHDRRFPDVAQTSALEFLFPICSVPGCTQAFGLERDHLRPWSDTGETRLTDLDRKCGQHHGEKTAQETRDRRLATGGTRRSA